MTSVSAVDIAVPQHNAGAGVAWPAILAGALAATALSFALLLLGSGLGMTMISPWVASGVGATTVAISTIVWLVITQAVSSGAGGYLAGRLRKRWEGVSKDESYFRDTAHGFFAWALATVFAAGLLGAAVTAVVGGGASAAGSIVSGMAQGAAQGVASQRGPGAIATDYFVDMFFRPVSPNEGARAADGNMANAKAEVSRILLTSLANGQVSALDKTQVTNLVAANTGISQADSQAHVDAVLGQISAWNIQTREAADALRKAGATLALVAFLSLLIGAFAASAAAACGGRHRDNIA